MYCCTNKKIVFVRSIKKYNIEEMDANTRYLIVCICNLVQHIFSLRLQHSERQSLRSVYYSNLC